MSSTISATSSKLTRRQFTAGAAALLACPGKLRADISPRLIRFGVFSLFEPRELTLQSAESMLLRLDDRQYVLAPNTASITAFYLNETRVAADLGSDKLTCSQLSAQAVDGGVARFTLSVPPSISHGGIRREFHGELKFQCLPRHLQPIVSMDIETAVGSIVSAESPPNAPPSFLMAQAVASRSFLIAAQTAHVGFDFCDTTHCQFLRGPVPAGSPASIAAARTAGLCLRYGPTNLPIAAMYCRSCSGRTRSLVELGLPVGDYPYYAVDCEFCRQHPETWDRTFEEPLAPKREPERLAFDRIHGWSALPSNSFTQRQDQVEGRGIGHGLGMCQRGAEAMARQGSDFNQILTHYYPNTTIAVA